MAGFRQGIPSWISAVAASRVDFEGTVSDAMPEHHHHHHNHQSHPHRSTSKGMADSDLGFAERSLSAAGAAFLSALVVNPLDVAKTRLQAQAAGVPYQKICSTTCFETGTVLPEMKSSPFCTRSALGSRPLCRSECSSHYKGTLDVLFKIIRQEGFFKLWRGTNASLALAVPTVGIYMPCYDLFRNHMEDFTTQNAPYLTPHVPLVAGSTARSLACITCYPVELARTRMQAFRDSQTGVKPPGVWKTLHGTITPFQYENAVQNFQRYRVWWTGLGAQLARDVPFSAICWSTLEPTRRRILRLMGDEAGAASVLGANFSAGYVAGSLAAAATCPLDVARTRRQIEKDPERVLKMTTRKTLIEIWRDGGAKGLFTGIGPRVGRAGPSVGIVVSFYEVVKYALQRRSLTSDSDRNT